MNSTASSDEFACGRGKTRGRYYTHMVADPAAGAVSGGSNHRPAAASDPEEEGRVRVVLTVNGRQIDLLCEPRWSLLFVLRERLGLTGTKMGCDRGECGACTVLIDGLPRYACLTLAVEAEGSRIITVEGLMNREALSPVQQAFVDHDAFQCGYCTPGQIMAAEGLLRDNPSPSDAEIREGMSGNLCRCGTYAHIFNAVSAAATTRKSG